LTVFLSFATNPSPISASLLHQSPVYLASTANCCRI